jgi:heat shock protein HslJ
MRRSNTLLLGILIALTAAACGGDDEAVDAGDAGDAGSAGSIDLEDPGDYVADDISEGGSPRALVAGTEIAIRFTDGEVSANAGCNSIGGTYTLDGDVLRVHAVSMTEMGCDGPRHDQDQWLIGFLSDAPRVANATEGIVLTTDTTTMTLVDRGIAHPDADLVGTTWVVTGFIEGDTASSGATDDAGTSTLTFGADGRVQGDDGCNDFSADYEVDGDAVRIGAPASTQAGCDDEARAASIRAVLGTTATYEIDGRNLTLMAQDGRGVTYTAEG